MKKLNFVLLLILGLLINTSCEKEQELLNEESNARSKNKRLALQTSKSTLQDFNVPAPCDECDDEPEPPRPDENDDPTLYAGGGSQRGGSSGGGGSTPGGANAGRTNVNFDSSKKPGYIAPRGRPNGPPLEPTKVENIFIDKKYANHIGNFEMNADLQKKYPKFASIVGSVVNIVKANPSIMDALKKYSGSSEEVILETLTYGSGPEVIVVDFGEKRDKVYGGYRRSVGKIEINEMIVEKFETLNAADESNKLAFVLCVFLLHESVHYGRHLNNLEKLYNELEAGEVFEIEAFGAEVNMYNADLISIKFKF